MKGPFSTKIRLGQSQNLLKNMKAKQPRDVDRL